MIIKFRNKPLPLQYLEALIPRLPQHFPKLADLKRDAAKRAKGYIGEKKVDYHLDLLADQYTILQDINLQIGDKRAQFDTIVIGKHAIFLIEIKNVSDTITFDTVHRQLIRDNGEKEEGFRYPITQAETQRLLLLHWLRINKFEQIPVNYFIAISEPSTIIQVKGNQDAITDVVAHAEYIPHMLVNQDANMKGKKIIPARQIANQLLTDCQEFNIDLRNYYGIRKSDILPGIQCTECQWLGMKRIYGKWHCPKCKHLSTDAHNRALYDYFLLIKPWISNLECMKFLKLNSRHTAKRILQSANLTYHPGKRIWTQSRK